MLVPFENSPNYTIGVELEILLIDPISQSPHPASPQILEKLHQSGYAEFKNEFNTATIEVVSPICPDATTCYTALKSSINTLMQVAEDEKLSLIMAGTHPYSHWNEMTPYPNERYKKIVNRMQIIANRVHVYGLHVHIGVPSGEDALAVMNGSIPYLPHLLALSANSPYWCGRDTGLDSYRYGVMDSVPYAGSPPFMSSWSEFSTFFNTLKNRKVIESIKDLYWHVRPSPHFGTIEFRVCDMPSSLDEVVAIAALTQCLVVWVLRELKQQPNLRIKNETQYALLRENMMMAQRYGLGGNIFINDEMKRTNIADDFTRILQMLTPLATEYGCTKEFHKLEEMITAGNGALRQRDRYSATNSLNEVVRMLESDFIPN